MSSNSRNVISRRRVAGLLPALLLPAIAAFAADPVAEDDAHTSTEADVVVHKTPWCGCCRAWAAQLVLAGLTVDTIDTESTAAVQSELGVPTELRSCHTARVGKLWVEGHVPPDLVLEMRDDPPAGIRGLAVPGMPAGSAGMEGPNPVRYAVARVTDDGEVELHALREGREAPPAE